jgi:hypothetical protein
MPAFHDTATTTAPPEIGVEELEDLEAVGRLPLTTTTEV